MRKPGLIKECFHIQTRIGGVLKQFPAYWTVPQSSLPKWLDGSKEFRPRVRVDSVIHRHQHRTMLQLDARCGCHVRPMSWMDHDLCLRRVASGSVLQPETRSAPRTPLAPSVTPSIQVAHYLALPYGAEERLAASAFARSMPFLMPFTVSSK